MGRFSRVGTGTRDRSRISAVRAVTAVLLASMVAAACSDGDSAGDNTASIPPAITTIVPAVTVARRDTSATDVPAPCSILDVEDFAAADVPVLGPGVDMSASIGLATNTSAACQWTGDGTWDLLVGRGGAMTAYEFDRG